MTAASFSEANTVVEMYVVERARDGKKGRRQLQQSGAPQSEEKAVRNEPKGGGGMDRPCQARGGEGWRKQRAREESTRCVLCGDSHKKA